ncbi:GATA transcription factor 26-like [Cornus florida]|uniref:GATA transcription factor 26-like n=1 Tax=Cornus florida TaxID=4283 RepID=UPI0028A0B01E|nr:GATA transcription factor 26-like [Cornus florida]
MVALYDLELEQLDVKTAFLHGESQFGTDTPLWRHGPPHKPVLCNACGSRWRVSKTLDNYMPKHASASEVSGSKDTQSYQQGKLPPEVEPVIPMRAHSCKKPHLEPNIAGFDHCSAGFGEDTNNKCTSESVISLSDSCIQMGSINGKDDPGSFQPAFWKPHVPTRKKSKLKQRILSPVERLQRQLRNILQEPEFSMMSKDEDILIYDSNRMFSTETALGAMLLKSPAASSTERGTKAHACRKSDAPVESSSS